MLIFNEFLNNTLGNSQPNTVWQ